MLSGLSRKSQIMLLGLISLAGVTTVIVFADAGFVTGVVVLTLLVGLSMIAMIIDRSLVPNVLKNPTGAEWFVLTASVLLIIGTGAAALVVDNFAWIGVPLVGFLIIHSVHGLNRSGESALSETQDAQIPEVHSQPDGILGRWFDTLTQVDIFADLTPDELRQIAGLGAVKSVRDGEGLGVEGQKGSSTYVLLRGQAELSAFSTVGRITARVAGPGESLPLASILGDGTLITSIHARTDVLVWVVDSNRLLSHFADNPETAAKVYKATATILAERYRSTLRRLTEQSAAALRTGDFWVNV